MTPTGYPPDIYITEVGPRDGLQNEPHAVSTQDKVDFVRALVDAGCCDIEVSSFVHPDRVPQLADAADVFKALGPPPRGVTYGALVPNMRGLDRALDARATKIAVFTAASDTFNQRNINTTIEGAMAKYRPMIELCRYEQLPVRGYVSMSVWCPYEGEIAPDIVRNVCEELLAAGCDEVSIGDTIGAATPADVARLLDEVLCTVRVEHVVLHFHDTRGTALANVMEGLRHGVVNYDSSAGGFGGCPFAPGASGNLATEDLVYLMDRMNIGCGIDLALLREATDGIARALRRDPPSRAHAAPPLPGSPDEDLE